MVTNIELDLICDKSIFNHSLLSYRKTTHLSKEIDIFPKTLLLRKLIKEPNNKVLQIRNNKKTVGLMAVIHLN